MSFWKRAIVWTKVKDTLAIGAILSQAGFELGNASEQLRLVIGAGTFVGYIIGMWMEDKDKNGIVDIFETEVTTTIKSATPIEITTEETTKQ